MPEHLRYWFADWLRRQGGNEGFGREGRSQRSARPVKLARWRSRDQQTGQMWLLAAKQTQGMRVAREIVTEGLANTGGSAIMLDYNQQAVAGADVDRRRVGRRRGETARIGDPALQSLKSLCGLDANERRKRQEGKFAAEYESIRYAGSVRLAGNVDRRAGRGPVGRHENPPGEIRRIGHEDQGPGAGPRGLGHDERLCAVLGHSRRRICAPRWTLAMRSCDRFTREFVAMEDAAHRYPDVENCPVRTYNSTDGETMADELPKVIRSQPNVIVARDLGTAQTASMLLQDAVGERLIISTVRAADSAEALMRVLSLGVPPAELAKAVTAVINQRLVRKLCESCKEAYTPRPDILAQLGIPEGRVKAFYRPPQPPQPGADSRAEGPPKEPCTKCGAVGYLGRTAIFELLVVGDAVRKALTKNPKLDVLRQAARKDGMKSLQEEGALLVVKGTTSLPEVIRVLKQ